MMRIRKTAKLAMVSGAAVALMAVIFACGFDPPEKNPNPPKSGGGTCTPAAGEYPAPDCDNSAKDCTANGVCTGDKTTGCCKIEDRCGDSKTCLPMADNKGKSVLDLRIRRLNIASPDSLSTDFMQNVVVTKNIDLQADGKAGRFACGELGQGAFNWLLRIDKTAGTLTTGGGPPPKDAFGTGYCFYRKQVGNIFVQQVTGKVNLKGDTFDSDPVDKLNVPIFVGGNISNVVILPLSKASFKNVTLSDDDNCIGKLNPSAIAKDCTDVAKDCQKWKTAGSLGAYITIEEADDVNVKDLSSSLCVVLTKSTKDPSNNKCQRVNGKIPFEGDYCSTTNKPGDCKDSFWITATLAASAAKITDGNDVPECHGIPGEVPDAGPEAGRDAAPDAPVDAPIDSPADAPGGG